MIIIGIETHRISTVVDTSGFSKLQKQIVLSSKQLEKMKVESKNVFDQFSKGGAKAQQSSKMLEKELKDINAELLKQYNLGSKSDKAMVQGLKERQKLANAELQTMKASNNARTQGLTDIVAKVGKFMVATAILSTFTGAMYKAVDVMKDVDTQLAEIGKVLDTPIDKLTELRDRSYEVASAMGVSATRYLEAVTAFTRAGYKEISDELGQLSVQTQIAGDMEADLANDFILAADKAYSLGGSILELNRIVDMSNQITNRNAVEMKDLTAGFKVAGSQAAQMGLSVEETNAAIGTMVAVTRQGGNIAGRALKGILMNVQQVKG